ncbi:MAG TPA: response regulator transcription factor, partial [Candidatus Limnocylindria bacterium]
MAEHPDVPKDGRTSSVLIIDDSAAVRAGIRALIDTDASLRTVGDAPNALEGLELARALRPDLILLDNEMPGTRGIDLLPTLRSEVPGSRVVMFSMSPAIADQARALGASAAVRKDGSDAGLLEALREVRRGEASTTVQLAAFARLRRERPTVAAHDVGILFTAVASYAVAFLVVEPRLGASAAVV